MTPPTTQLAGVVLAAGQGTRLKSARPKVLHGLAAGRSSPTPWPPWPPRPGARPCSWSGGF